MTLFGARCSKARRTAPKSWRCVLANSCKALNSVPTVLASILGSKYACGRRSWKSTSSKAFGRLADFGFVTLIQKSVPVFWRSLVSTSQTNPVHWSLSLTGIWVPFGPFLLTKSRFHSVFNGGGSSFFPSAPFGSLTSAEKECLTSIWSIDNWPVSCA